MEAGGFAKTLGDKRKQWLVFRGISDFGDPDKDRDCDWQPVASLVALTMVRKFLEHSYVHPSLDRALSSS